MALLPDAAVKILAYIKRQKLQPGDRLPIEVDLAQQIDVGRPQLRESKSILSVLGVIESRRKGGTFVLVNDISGVETRIRQLHEELIVGLGLKKSSLTLRQSKQLTRLLKRVGDAQDELSKAISQMPSE